jgi:eukaryotic-like serine/threonine-protein kinase
MPTGLPEQQSSPVGVQRRTRLNSWKEIAGYLATSVRTVQRWEQSEGLPVHRHEHASVATVYAYSSEVDAWFAGRGQDPQRKVDPSPTVALPPRRLIILPFRLLQADPRIEFLSFGLADAVAGSLCGLDSLVVRSSVVGAQYVGDVDLKRVAKESAVDLVLTGTLLRSGEQLRVTAQLVEAASGTAVWSQTSHGGLGNVFELQDQVATRILEALALPLDAREQQLSTRDVPASPAAYEYYLRANELAYDFDPAARDLYTRCIEEDPNYAPAWARLGRCCRIVAKFGGDQESFARAEAALARALELRPSLAVAHNQLAYLEADSNLADRAMVRLLAFTESRRNDPEVFAGLVHVCRFCGLLEASIAAHERAFKLDPTIRTSVCHTYFLLGNYQRALETSREVIGYLGPLALLSLGRVQEALELARQVERTSTPLTLVRCAFSSSRALVEGARAEAIAVTERMVSLIVRGPEELFQQARHLAYLSENGRALAVLARGVDQGFFCYPALARDPWLHPLRVHPEFEAILRRALERHRTAVRMFVEAGGERVLAALPAATRSLVGGSPG